MIASSDWNEVQKHEAAYWGNCLGMVASGEFCKGEMYGREMGLFAEYGRNSAGEDLQGELDMQGKSVLDVGGGPVSMTLRCIGSGPLVVVDPCNWPPSVARRYRNYGITFIQAPAEELRETRLPFETYDEVWIYNVLQHVKDPAAVVDRALARVAKDGVLRIFEWVYIPADACHPHVLNPADLLNWFAGWRIVKIGLPHLTEYWSDATAFTGIFKR
jgi:2-polyprenyl-3-methyl-5-hydroxy-6-metoxy-1,4-benzoquinol methylase